MDKRQIELLGRISFQQAENFARGDKPDFEIMAYTGKPVKRAYGNLAIDIAGIQCKDSMPIFREHSRDQIVGYSTKTKKDGGFVVVGKFSNNTISAKEVQALAGEGFPWQASIGVAPLPGAVTTLQQDQTAVINGHTVTAPAEVWTRCEVYETSFVALGADADTSVACFDGLNQHRHFDRVGEAVKFYASADLQHEFFGDVEAYLAFRKAEINGGFVIPEGTTKPYQLSGVRAETRAPEHPEAAKFFSDPDLQDEFGDFETFNAYLTARDAGFVKI